MKTSFCRARIQVEQLEDRTLLSGTPQPLPALYPADFVAIGSTTYFTAYDNNGGELWKTDGTVTGTMRVADINPGSNSSNPTDLTNFNGQLYFSANDGTQGYELWKSDGTPGGTTMVADINPGGSSNPTDLTMVNGELFFAANDGTHGTELWKSDGTTTGTTMVKDIYPGTTGYNGSDPNSSSPTNLTSFNGKLYFSATDANGTELWTSDGTGPGTVSIPGVGSPGNFTNVNGTLYFSGQDGTHGYELWKTDGTAAGTTRVADIDPGSASSFPENLTNFNGTLYFSANDGIHGDQLWKSDGDATTTVRVSDIPGQSQNITDLTDANGELYFSANDGTHGQELWKSDGTTAGTTMVKDICPSVAHTYYYSGDYGYYVRTNVTNSSYPSNLTSFNGKLYFSANDGADGCELWQSDGTISGTTMVEDIYPGSSWVYSSFGSGMLYGGIEYVKVYLPNSSNPNNLTKSNGTLFFSADGGLWMVPTGPSLAVTAASTSPTAGQADTFTITALNADGMPDTSLNGAVNITSSDPTVPPASVTLTNGTGQFSVTFETAGTPTVSAAVAQSPGDNGSVTDILVQAAAANSLTLTGFPSPATVGISSNFTVTAYDQYGNVATGYSGTVHFNSSDSTAILPADTTLTGGVGQFRAVLQTVGTNASLSATDTQNAGLTATEAGIEVIPFASISAPSAGAIGLLLTCTLGAGADPAGTVFTVSWGDGTSVQTTATTATHTYTTNAVYFINVTASAAGLSSNPAAQAVNILPVSVTVTPDPAKAGAEILVVASTAISEDLILVGSGSGVSLSFNYNALGTVLPTVGEAFALVEVFAAGAGYNTVYARGLSVSSVLVGGPGNDTLTGGSGRNLLIGGPGLDTLYAGSAGDILIGGTISYDANTAGNQKALAYIMAEWDSTASYSTRMKYLSGKAGSGGLNGSYFLNSATVQDDNASDLLYGYSQAAGASLEWFFAHYAKQNGDKVYNLVNGEVVTKI